MRLSIPTPFRVLRKRRAPERSCRWNREELEGEQLRRLAALRRFAVEHSPFYRRFHSGFEGRPLNELPVLIKAIITVAPPPGAGQP